MRVQIFLLIVALGLASFSTQPSSLGNPPQISYARNAPGEILFFGLEQAYSAQLGAEDSAYFFTAQDGGYVASNPDHQLQMTFANNQISLQWGTETLQLRMTNSSVGEIWAQGNRLEYRRPDLTEWYINGPLGVEQGFTVDAPMPIQFALSGSFEPILQDNTLVFKDAMGWNALHYSGIVAYDADHQALPVVLHLQDTILTLVVDDTFAHYPITIDPWIQQAKLWGPDTTSINNFGDSVSVDGNTAIIGAPRNNFKGAAYIFTTNGTTWTYQAKLLAPDGLNNDYFGYRVDIDGDNVVVGAFFQGINSAGAAYAYRRTGTTWTFQNKLVASDAASNDQFGNWVAIDGNFIVVGNRYDDNHLGNEAGSVYVYGWNGTSWVQTQKLLASDGVAADQFGHSVDIQGTRIIVGTIGDDEVVTDSGSVYVFDYNSSTWNQTAKLTVSDPYSGQYNGLSVSADANNFVVGGKGGIYVFVWDGIQWSQQAKLVPSTAPVLRCMYCYYKAAISGDIVAIGYDGTNDDQGGYVFRRTGTVWTEETELFPSYASPLSSFGESVAVHNTIVLIGASGDADRGTGAGAAYAYGFLSPTLTNTPSPTYTTTDTPSATFTNNPTACVNIATAPKLTFPPHRMHTSDRTPDFAWSAVSNVQSYRLMVYVEDRSFEYKKRLFTNGYTLTAQEALPRGKYLWRVRAQEMVCSKWSVWSIRHTLFVD